MLGPLPQFVSLGGRGAAVLVLAASSLLGVGCGADEPALVPLRGRATYRTQPIPGARLVFHPQFDGPGWLPVADVAADGSFAAGTKLPGDGALPGAYRVTAVWQPDLDSDPSQNLLPPRFAEPHLSPLEIVVGASPDEFHLLELKD